MRIGCAQEPNHARDLTRGMSAWLLWYLPIVLLVAGGAWPHGGAWLWAAAFLVMGAGCLANAARCGRTHCYVTGPLFVLAALWSLLSALSVIPVAMHPRIVLLVVFGITVLSFLAEVPFGRYTQAHR